MYWLSNLLAPNKAYTFQPIFGDKYFATLLEDIDDTCNSDAISRKDTKINIEIVPRFLNYQKLCDIFGISKFEFLKAIAPQSNNMETILNFLNKNINGDTLICNIYMIDKETVVKCHSKHATLSRVNVLLGHHIVLCIPLTERIYDLVTAKVTLKLLMHKKDIVFADYFLTNSVALIDYIDIIKRPACEILNELNDYPFSNDICLFAELPKNERVNNFAAERLASITILKLVKLITLMKEKFFFLPFNCRSRKMKGEDGIKEISDYIIKTLKEFRQWDNPRLLPLNLKILYEIFALYKHLYLLALHESNSVPAIDAEFENYVDLAYQLIKELPLTQFDGNWIFAANDENAKNMYQKYLAGWWCILMTKNTKHLVPKLFYKRFIWVISEETKWKDNVEPILYNGTDESSFGTITPQTCNKQKYANGTLFRHPCSCDNDKEIVRAWICATCKEIFQTVDESHICCNCGIHNFEIQKKRCFKCIKEETKNILFTGQSDAGKSMLINSINNYLNYSFDEILNAQTVNCIVPCHFRIHASDSVFQVGSEDENEKRNSKVYSLKTENFNIQIIDTPGFDDTRIIDNLNLIQYAIIDIQKLHAICFVIPSSILKLKANFEAHMRTLFLMLSKRALKNVFFLLTYANFAFSPPEDTINYLKEYIKIFEETQKVKIPFGPENVFCVDNDSLMYFIASKQGRIFTENDQENIRNSWNKSKERIEIFLSKVKTIDSVKSDHIHDDILMADKVEQIETTLPNENDDTHISTTPDNQNIFAFPKQITNMNQEIDAVGIDLGTSRCCVAVNRKSGIETIPLENTGERLLPSYVGYDEINTKCGQIVIDRLRYFSEASVFDSKRIIGRSIVVIDKMWSFKVVNINNRPIIKLTTDRGEIQQTATEVAAALLKYMKEKADQFQGKTLSKVVITVPAAFTKAQEEATKEAAILAGWESVTLLPEPIAASFAYFVDRPIPNNSILLLFDLGGGTLDVCVFKIANDQIQIISKNGDSKLGGRDFDNLLMDYFSNKLNLDYGISELGNKKFKLLMECQKIKHNLSVRNDDQLDVEDIEADRIGLIKISQQNFNDLAEDLLNKIQNTIFSALYKSGYKTQQINRVLQVGGGCRMPMIKQLLKDLFKSAEHCCEEHPDEVVAIGAAHYAYNISSN